MVKKKAAAGALRSGFPECLYVTREEEDGDIFYVSYVESENAGEHGDSVAIYVLDNVQTKVVKHELRRPE